MPDVNDGSREPCCRLRASCITERRTHASRHHSGRAELPVSGDENDRRTQARSEKLREAARIQAPAGCRPLVDRTSDDPLAAVTCDGNGRPGFGQTMIWRHTSAPRRSIRPAPALLGIHEPRPLQLDPARNGLAIVTPRRGENGVSPTERGGRTDMNLHGRAPDADAVGEAIGVEWPEVQLLDSGCGGTGQITERAATCAAAVTLPAAEGSPAVGVVAVAARTTDAVAEPGLANRCEDRVNRSSVGRVIRWHVRQENAAAGATR